MIPRVLIISAGLLLSFSIACATSSTTQATQTPSEPTEPPTGTPLPTASEGLIIIDEATRGAVKLTLLIEAGDDIVSTQDTVNLRARVENLSDEPIDYTMWNIGDHPVYFKLQTPFDEDAISLRDSDGPEIVLPTVNSETLDAGATVEREIQWDVTLPSLDGSPSAPDGSYFIHADFFPVTDETSDPESPLRASVEISVVGSLYSITTQEAVTRALEPPEVRRWMEGHTGQAIAKINEEGERLVNQGGNWQSVDQDQFLEVQSEKPSPRIEFQGENWLVTMSSEYGYPPAQILVQVDANLGDIVELSPDLEEELRGGVVAVFELDGTSFSLFTTNERAIQQLLALQQGTARIASIPNGALRPGPGPGLHNVPWSWHLDPEDVGLTEVANETCDGEPEVVHQELKHWLDTVGRYCPRNAQLSTTRITVSPIVQKSPLIFRLRISH